MGEEIFDFNAEIPALPVERAQEFEEDWLQICMRGRAASAHIVKLDKTWRCVASFTSEEGRKQFAKAWENIGFRIGAGKQDVAAIRKNIPEKLRKAFDEGVKAGNQQMSSASRQGWKPMELPEGTILFAVLFDKHRETKLILPRTTEEEAATKGREIDAPLIVFISAKYAGGIDTDFSNPGMLVDPGYGDPSQRIREQLASRALKEVLNWGEEQFKAFEASAGHA